MNDHQSTELIHNIDKDHEYLLSCYNKTTEEIIFRVRHRDAWLKTQFIAQLTIVAIGLGVTFGSVRTSTQISSVFALSMPISLVISILYYIEENIISLMSRYLSDLSGRRREILDGSLIDNFDSSRYALLFFKETQILRIVAQSVSFIIIPVMISIYDLFIENDKASMWYPRMMLDIVSLSLIAFLMLRVHVDRWKHISHKD